MCDFARRGARTGFPPRRLPDRWSVIKSAPSMAVTLVLCSMAVVGGAAVGSPTQRLIQDGYAVMDNVLDPSIIRHLRESAAALFEAGAMHNFGQEGRDDDVIVLDPASLASPSYGSLKNAASVILSIPDLLIAGSSRDEDSTQDSLEYFSSTSMPKRLMLARYPASGGQYVPHLDNDPSDPGHADGPVGLRAMDRSFTCILYLNDGWEVPDEGCLRLFKPSAVSVPETGVDTIEVDVDGLLSSSEDDYVDIEPVGGRLVIFDSKRILHAVLPSYAERWAITGWV